MNIKKSKYSEKNATEKDLHIDDKTNSERVNTGSSASTIPERATEKHTETTPAPKK